MKGFYHIWAWRPSWSCDLDFLYTHWFPFPIDASYKIWLWLAKRFQRRRSLKLWTDGRTDDGRTPDHGHPISSPCEPNGSGELKTKQSDCIFAKTIWKGVIVKGSNNFMIHFLARLHEVHRAIAVTPVVHVPVPVPVRVRVRVTLALKFSRSPYLENHSSESIHTWTIDTL